MSLRAKRKRAARELRADAQNDVKAEAASATGD
jgi:hypothetical protein